MLYKCDIKLEKVIIKSLFFQGCLIFATLLLSVQKMALKQVVEELTMAESEFRGHRHVLSRYPKGITYKDVANYLYRNKALSTRISASFSS